MLRVTLEAMDQWFLHRGRGGRGSSNFQGYTNPDEGCNFCCKISIILQMKQVLFICMCVMTD